MPAVTIRDDDRALVQKALVRKLPRPWRDADGHWRVASHSGGEAHYMSVNPRSGAVTCSCPQSAKAHERCYHAAWLDYWLAWQRAEVRP